MQAVLQIEIIYMGNQSTFFVTLSVAINSTVSDALIQANILDFMVQQGEIEEKYQHDISILANRVGMFGKRVSLNTPLTEENRIEIYRPLFHDPKDARRKRARKNKLSKK